MVQGNYCLMSVGIISIIGQYNLWTVSKQIDCWPSVCQRCRNKMYQSSVSLSVEPREQMQQTYHSVPHGSVGGRGGFGVFIKEITDHNIILIGL